MTEIVLPKCPTCGHVGAIPLSSWSGKTYCTGSLENKHAKERMLPTVFVEKRGKP